MRAIPPGFLKKAAAWPGRDLHVVCDNYTVHKHPAVKAWLAAHPRVTLHRRLHGWVERAVPAVA